MRIRVEVLELNKMIKKMNFFLINAKTQRH